MTKTLMLRHFIVALAAASLAAPVAAQEGPEPAETAEQEAQDGARCELHIWPIENYWTEITGLASAIPVIGFAIDQAASKNSSKAIQGLMGEYLGPETQIALLREQGVTQALGLEGYDIIVEDAFPSDAALKKSKELKANRKERIARIRAGERAADSQSPCYAELAMTFMIYQKTATLEPNFTIGWSYREFGNSPTIVREFSANSGEIRDGRLYHFPPAAEDGIEPAKRELQDQFSRGFLSFASKLQR